MASEQTTSSWSSGSSTSTPVPVNTPASDWDLELSKALADLGQQQYAWAQQQYAVLSGITDDMINRYIAASDQAMEMAGYDLNRYRSVFQPLEDQLIADAESYASDARKRFEMGRAESDVMQAGEQARKNAERQLESFGVNPSSGRYADLEASQRTAVAAAAAGAGQLARSTTEQVGRNLRTQALAIGQQYPGQIINSLNSAYQGIAGAQNAALGRANTGVNLMTSPAAYFNPAISGLKYPPTGQQSKSQQAGGSSGEKSDDKDNKDKKQQPAPPEEKNPFGKKGEDKPGPNAGLVNNPFVKKEGEDKDKPRENEDDYQPNEGNYADSFAYPYLNADNYDPSNPFAPPVPQDPFTQPDNPMPGQMEGWGVPYTRGDGDARGQFYSGADATQPFTTPGQGWEAPAFNPPQWPATQYDQPQYTMDSGEQPYIPNNSDWTVSPDDLNTPDQPTNSGYDTGNDYGPPDTGGYTYDNSGSTGYDFNDPGVTPNTGEDYYVDNSDAGSSYDFGDYARGGAVDPNATTGGFVSRQLSPSRGQTVDDIPARLNADEFVIPRDVAMWKGQEYFQKLIEQSRKARSGAPARPTMGMQR